MAWGEGPQRQLRSVATSGKPQRLPLSDNAGMSDYIIGLTGGIASGKSALEIAFIAHGVVVVDADLIAREVVEPGQPALAGVVAHFGGDVLQPDGRLDRAALRARVFGDDAQRRVLEGLLHPVIRERIQTLCENAPGPYAVAMVPLLTEGGGRVHYPLLDRILVVDVPVPTQKIRLMQRDGIDAELADWMIAAQASRSQRLAIADDVVVNDGDIGHLQAAVIELDARYRLLADAKAAIQR